MYSTIVPRATLAHARAHPDQGRKHANEDQDGDDAGAGLVTLREGCQRLLRTSGSPPALGLPMLVPPVLFVTGPGTSLFVDQNGSVSAPIAFICWPTPVMPS